MSITDPRVTPMNDAPVTVEQADAEVARIMAMSDDEIMREADADDAAWARGFKLGLASGKSAALASAPAGDGDALQIARDAMVRHFGPGKSSANPAEWVIEAMQTYAAALARPRAAVAPAECSLCGTGPHDPDCPHHPVYDTLTEPASAPAGDTFTGVEAWDELVNVDDRTSPEEYPDMCLITRDELIDFMQRASAPAGDGVRDDCRVVPILPTQEMLDAGGGMIPGTEPDPTAAGIVWTFMLAAAPAALARPRAAVGERIEVVRDIDVPTGAWDWIGDIGKALDGPHVRLEQPRDHETIVLWHNEQPVAFVLNLRDQFNRSIQYRVALQSPPAKVEG